LNSVVLMIGERKNELGGSVYYSLYDEMGANVPKPNLEEVKNQIFALTDCIDGGLVLSCHDISDGGVASALAEMTFGNDIGCDINIDSNLLNEKLLWSETGGFILEISLENVDGIKTIFSHVELDIYEIGKTIGNLIQINNVVGLTVNKAKEAWTNGLREKL
jgi:phosphoribosylformylglycinamidine (FGAM) synthase-like enzyme